MWYNIETNKGELLNEKIIKIIKVILLSITLLVVIVSILNVSPFTFSKVKGVNQFRKTGGDPLIIPHGGAKDLAPENTVYAYDMLINKYQADVLEIDLSLTKDNILISHHDLDLEMSETSELNNKFIRNYTYKEIIDEYKNDDYYLARKFINIDGNKPFENITDIDVMSKMVPAKLETIFEEVGSDVLYILEIKDSPSATGYTKGIHDFKIAAQNLIDLVKKYKMEKFVVNSSFSDEAIDYFKKNASDLKVSAAVSEGTNFTIFSALYLDFFWKVKSEVLILPNPESMKIPKSMVGLISKLPKFITNKIAIKKGDTWHTNLTNKTIIKKAHRKNMAVIYWTVNDKVEMKELIAKGADGIITDRPDLLIEAIYEFNNKK